MALEYPHSFTDQNYLLTGQYNNADKLNARISLHQRFSTNPYDWHRWVFDQFQIPPQARILEIGCGPGTLWLKNQDRISKDWNITLSDLSEGMLQEAQPLVAFVLSTSIGEALIGNRVAEFTRFVEQEITEYGAIHIVKSTGLFEAY
ncbi:MAG: class I SAM-dependent methyltransferase [Chloroflexota bacterium]|nr:class I SAM-dependent methyltransferase [Chloroflexota bacterium]